MDAAVKELKLLKQKSGEVQIEAQHARAAYLSAQPGVKKEEMRQQWLSLIEDREMIDSKRTTLAIGIARAASLQPPEKAHSAKGQQKMSTGGQLLYNQASSSGLRRATST